LRCLADAALGCACALAFHGCNTNGCLENRNSVPLAGFYSDATHRLITVDSLQITGEGMPEDDPLLDAGSRVNQVYLPMRSTHQSTTWVFSYKQKELDFPELNDTLSFDYESTPYFAGNECGVVYYYDITHMEYTTHLIDSVAIIDSLVTNTDLERIQIYFRTGEPEP
ncbi:MAG: DUF6452 family protein, partial [Clostridium sp.]|nr:DUF6452 family protein [Clostridium sp.]